MASDINNDQILEKIIEHHLCDETLLNKANRDAQKAKRNIVSILCEEALVDTASFLKKLSNIYDLEYIPLKGLSVNEKLLSFFPARFASHYTVMPVSHVGNLLTVAISDPADLITLDDLESFLHINIKAVLASEAEIIECISQNYGLGAHTVHRLKDKDTNAKKQTEKAPISGAESVEPSIALLVNAFLAEALRLSATDVHLEPFEDGLRARYRIDGVLQEVQLPEKIIRFYPSIVSRIKIMAKLDISEKRLPQDGRIQTTIVDDHVDIRVSTMPLISGEAVHLRLLRQQEFLNLDALGFDQEQKQIIDQYIKKPNGIILVTGPTGSGKSTTLYASLSRINTEGLKIITVEDPVEYNLKGVNQIQVQPKIGLNFAEGLRHILRHDPDVMMVGEIRDRETAEIAIRSALTGHLVFSTLHTNDAATTVVRLLDMGFESYLLSTSLECIIAQRLVRCLCEACKKEVSFDVREYPELGFDQNASKEKIFEAVGCTQCRNSGYQGRTIIAEILTVDEMLRDLILTDASSQEIRKAAIASGMKTLTQNGLEKVLSGQTSLSEILRVIKED